MLGVELAERRGVAYLVVGLVLDEWHIARCLGTRLRHQCPSLRVSAPPRIRAQRLRTFHPAG